MKPLILTYQEIEELEIDMKEIEDFKRFVIEHNALTATYVIERDSYLGMWLLLKYPSLSGK